MIPWINKALKIKQCNEVLLIMDKLEENIPLHSQEKIFRAILKGKILKLDGQSWGVRALIFFHVVATERYMLNTITSIDTMDGQTLVGYGEKATHIWQEYRNRLSCTTHS
jgi:hypothetical protein